MNHPVSESTAQVLAEIGAERRRQDAKWGVQNHDQLRWLSIAMEELGEVARALYENWHDGASLDDAREEWIHTAAVCANAIESLDRQGVTTR